MEIDAKIVQEPKTNPNYLNGVFYFSNTSDEDFVVLWNGIEYIFPAQTCSPMLIPNTTAEETQEIRKRFALKWATDQWFNSKEYARMVKAGGRIPAIPNPKVFEPYVQMCLNPLPIKQATSKPSAKEKRTYKETKPITEKSFDPKADFVVNQEA